MEFDVIETIEVPCDGFLGSPFWTMNYLPSGEGFSCIDEDEVVLFGDFGVERMPYDKTFEFDTESPIYTVSSDNKLLLVANDDDTILVYDVFANEAIYQLAVPRNTVLHFSPDNKYLVTLRNNGVFRIYGVPITDD